MSDGDYERRDGRLRELAAMNARLARWRREADSRPAPTDGEKKNAADGTVTRPA